MFLGTYAPRLDDKSRLVLPAKLSWRALGAKNPFHAPHASLIALFTGMAIGLVLAWVWLRPRLPAAEPES